MCQANFLHLVDTSVHNNCVVSDNACVIVILVHITGNCEEKQTLLTMDSVLLEDE
jgi:hypothetical protein